MTVNIHFITGSKGNVGKSAWAEALVAFYAKQKRKLILIDGDKDVPTLSKTCPDAQPVVFSDNPGLSTQPDTISELAYEESRKKKGADLLIDMPAGGERHLNEWMDDCSLNSLAEKYKFKLIKWWVSDSDADSIKLFRSSLEKYPKIQHVFLKNRGKSFEGQWENFDNDKSLQKLIKSRKGIVLEIPGVDPAIINSLRASGVPLTQIIKDEEFKLANIGVNLRVNTWVSRTGAIAEQVISFKDLPISTVDDNSSEQAASSTVDDKSSEQAAVPAT